MKAFITGGTGFIGSHLINSLLAQDNIDIYALVRDLDNLKWLQGLNINTLHGDLQNIPQLPADLDYVFHIAGFTKAHKSADYYTVNQEGTASFFKALRTSNCSPKRIIYMSSMAAAGPCSLEDPLAESCTPSPISPYGESKLQGEKEVLKYKDEFPVAIIRVGPVFGPRDRDFLPLLKMVKQGFFPAFGKTARKVSLCYVKDLVKALILCMQKELDNPDIFHIADPRPYTWDEFSQAAAEVLGKKSTRIRIPLPVIYIAALCSELMAKLQKKPSIFTRHKYQEMKQEAWMTTTAHAQDVLSFAPDYSLKEGLQETITWYQDKGWL